MYPSLFRETRSVSRKSPQRECSAMDKNAIPRMQNIFEHAVALFVSLGHTCCSFAKQISPVYHPANDLERIHSDAKFFGQIFRSHMFFDAFARHFARLSRRKCCRGVQAFCEKDILPLNLKGAVCEKRNVI